MKSTLLLRVAAASAVALTLFAVCCVEPPRTYYMDRRDGRYVASVPDIGPTRAHVDMVPVEQPSPSVGSPDSGSPPTCSDLVCGDFTIDGTMSAQSFIEGAPIVYDVPINSPPFEVGENTTTIIVRNELEVGTLVLPLAANSVGRIIRIKAIGNSEVNVFGHSHAVPNERDQIDDAPSYCMQWINGAPWPSVTVQAYENTSLQPGDPKRFGWAVIAVSP